MTLLLCNHLSKSENSLENIKKFASLLPKVSTLPKLKDDIEENVTTLLCLSSSVVIV
jgi:hypothetical protein